MAVVQSGGDQCKCSSPGDGLLDQFYTESGSEYISGTRIPILGELGVVIIQPGGEETEDPDERDCHGKRAK